ncbi:MAG: HAD family hydrolase [Candidatus Thorarchaeota archaeon]|nr:HAD family hydrolase [Candidatus Thorarchaeota archaeon]
MPRALLFDLHHTLTKTCESQGGLFRTVCSRFGIDLTRHSVHVLDKALSESLSSIHEYQLAHNVEYTWFPQPEDWLKADRELFRNLGYEDMSDTTLMSLRREYIHEFGNGWETLHEQAEPTLRELRRRGYVLGLCTRRGLDPRHLLQKWGVDDVFSVVEYSAVVGYQKPSPFTLLRAAEALGLNPRLCAYVGNAVDADVAAAVRAEMVPVLLTWAGPESDTVVPEGTLVLNEIRDLLKHF